MAKGDKEQRQSKMLDLGDKLTQGSTKMIVQEIKPTEEIEVKTPKKEEEGEKGFHLFIPNTVYWKVKETCVEERISMKDFINTFLTEDMIKRGKIKPK